MKTVTTLVFLLGLFVLLSGGCEKPEMANARLTPPPPPPPEAAPEVVRTYDYSQKLIVDPQQQLGHHWSVAILRFGDTREVEGVPFGHESENSPAGGDNNVNVTVVTQQVNLPPVAGQTPPRIGKKHREILKHALVQSNAFTVVERERILELLREVNFGKTAYVDPETAPEAGQMLCVRYLLEGHLGFNEEILSTDSESLADAPGAKKPNFSFLDNVFNPGKEQLWRHRQKQLLRLKESKEEFRAEQSACYLSAYEVRTGQVKAMVMGTGKTYLEAIEDAVSELSLTLSKVDDGLHVAAVSGDKIYLDVGSKGGVVAGQRYQLLHLGEKILSRDGQVLGYDETEVGEVEVVDVREYMSIAKTVRKSGEISRGDIAKPAKH